MQQQAAVMTFDYNRDPQDLTFYHCFMLVALVTLGTILSWFDQFQFFFYVKIWTKTKSYVCFIMCDVLLKDMHWYLQSIGVATNLGYLTEITGCLWSEEQSYEFSVF